MYRRLLFFSASLITSMILHKLSKLSPHKPIQFPKIQSAFTIFPRLALCQSKQPYLGCSIRALQSGEGMIILLVNSGSPAQSSGLLRGDIIVKIQGVKIQNIHDFRQAITSGSELVFTVLRQKQEVKIQVKL